MVELTLTLKEIELLFPALKMAESGFTEAGNFKACKALTTLYAGLHKQVFTYGQVDEEELEYYGR